MGSLVLKNPGSTWEQVATQLSWDIWFVLEVYITGERKRFAAKLQLLYAHELMLTEMFQHLLIN